MFCINVSNTCFIACKALIMGQPSFLSMLHPFFQDFAETSPRCLDSTLSIFQISAKTLASQCQAIPSAGNTPRDLRCPARGCHISASPAVQLHLEPPLGPQPGRPDDWRSHSRGHWIGLYIRRSNKMINSTIEICASSHVRDHSNRIFSKK